MTAETTVERSVRWPLLLVLASLAALAPVATDLYLPGFPALGADLHAGASRVQLTLTTFLIGMAVGQLFMGPISDRFGRRRPLILSAAVCVVAGVVCALAPTLAVLVAGRLLQGLAGAGGMVIGRAVISDLVTGLAAARAYTLMITVGGIAPVLAPVVGGLLVDPIGWRGLLWLVVALCALMLAGVVVALPETHAPGSRTPSGTSVTAGVRAVLRVADYRAPVAVFACAFGVMMAYISASPFVYQRVVGLSATAYGVAFGVNAAGLIGSGWVASRLVQRLSPLRMVRTLVVVQLAAAAVFLLLATLGSAGWLLPVPIFVAIACNGGIMGNAAALAMSHVRAFAGTGSAVLGFAQFSFGAAVSPLVGLGGESSAVVPAVVITACAAAGVLASRRLGA